MVETNRRTLHRIFFCAEKFSFMHLSAVDSVCTAFGRKRERYRHALCRVDQARLADARAARRETDTRHSACRRFLARVPVVHRFIGDAWAIQPRRWSGELSVTARHHLQSRVDDSL